MDDVQEMMEGLAIDESSLVYVDFEYEFDACHFFDFCVDETDYDVLKSERWFLYDHGYNSAPYKMKINLTNLFIGTPAKDDASSSMELKVISPSIVTPTNFDIPPLQENNIQVTASSLSVREYLDDIQRLRAAFKESAANESVTTNRSPKPCAAFMKPTVSHLAKQINAEDTHAGSCGRSPRLQTPTRSVTEDPKRQKLEIGFLRKVSQLNHQASYSHKTTIKSGSKTTIPKEPKLLTEERARMRSFRSKSKAETNTNIFKAQPSNKNFFSNSPLAIPKKSMTDTPIFQKFHFKYNN
ncbi:uncharacterized protein [Rutidosis leptorrhynchoides]|uniref:uncharacterized protein n=1 Tax=Rutidosis leptorrhynchoides TaxID=125765 RepID=UPI003A9A0551